MNLKIIFCFLLAGFGMIAMGKSSQDSLKRALEIHQTNDSARVDLLNQLSYEYWIVDAEKAESLSREALVISKKISYLKGMAFANRSIGVTSWVQGNYEEGLDVLLTALSQYQLLKDTLNIANVRMNTGLIYSEQNSFNQALSYYEEALATFQLLNKPEREVNTLNHIGELYSKRNSADLALEKFKAALTISIQHKFVYGKSTALSNLATLFQKLNKLDSALTYANQALEIQNKGNDLNGQAFSLYNIGVIYQKQENYKLANKYMLLALNAAEVISSKKLKRDSYLKLKQIASKTEDFQEALYYAEQYTSINDSLFNAEKLRECVRLENRFELEKNEQALLLKEQEVSLLKSESKIGTLWRNLLIVAIIAVLIISYLIYIKQRSDIKRKKELFAKNEEIYLAKEALTQVELENARLKEIELNQKIDYKNKELTSYTLNFMQKNELMEEIKLNINNLKKSQNAETIKNLNSLNRLVNSSMHIDKDWQDFKRQFEEVHTDFFRILKATYPTLTNNELKLCALLKLNMNLKEAATVMGISPESVKTARYRLRKKLGLEREDNLIENIISIEKNVLD